MDPFINLAVRMADEAGNIARKYYRADFTVESKSDETPVTIADRTIEKTLREMIERERPEDGILGEEFGGKESKNSYTWVLDPIDGTKSFIIGRPLFGTLIALCKDNVPVLGIIDQPILKERWIGVEGRQTTFNDAPVQTRPCPDIQNARVSTTDPSYLSIWQRFKENCAFIVWGGDCYSYAQLASGTLDIVIENGLAPHDFAALAPVINGAGGVMCDWQGKPLTLQSDGRVCALGNPALKEDVLSLLKE